LKKLPAALSALIALLLACQSHAASQPVTVPTDQARCFQVQYLLRLNGLASLHFVQQVAALRELDPTDPAVTTRVAGLSRQAISLRHDEAQNFTRVSRLFRLMGAPSTLQSWSEAAEAAALAPVLMTDDERKTAAQPDTANVLATLDECDRLETETDDHMASLGQWLGLTYHTAGLWAADVGEVTAALHMDVTDGVPPQLSATLGRHLEATAPANTPASVKAALGLLSPPAGNLSDLAPATTILIPLPQAAQAQDALLLAFSVQG
jgi:hypothetical protein